MPTSNRQYTVSVIEQERVSAIIRTQDQTLAHDAMQSAVEGGFRLVEFTLTTPGALELVKEFSKNPELTVGAGTVMTPEQATLAVAAGARFLVSPITDAEVVAAAADLDVVCIPGAQTPTEMETAHRLGADFIKVFPAPAGGVDRLQPSGDPPRPRPLQGQEARLPPLPPQRPLPILRIRCLTQNQQFSTAGRTSGHSPPPPSPARTGG